MSLGWSGIRVAGFSLKSLTILFHFLCAQHVSDINIYIKSGACDYSVELPHWSYCSWFDVCWSFGVVGLEWYPCCRLQPEITILFHFLCAQHVSGINIYIYITSGACDYSVELPHWSYCSCFDVCWSFGVVGLEWYPCCRLQPEVTYYFISLLMCSTCFGH